MGTERTTRTGHPDAAAGPGLIREVERLRIENRRLERLLGLSGPHPLPEEQARRPLFGGVPGVVNASSAQSDKVLFFLHLFAGREDVHALRWENERTGRSGWVPAVEGGFHRSRQNRSYLPLTDEVITAHLTGTIHAGVYPLMSDDGCRLLACDFDGPGALLDALAYTKAARAADVPTALEISRSGTGAHVWMFFSDAVEAAVARRIGAGLIREAIAMRGELDLSSYDRFFPSQDFLPRSGSIGVLGSPRCQHRVHQSVTFICGLLAGDHRHGSHRAMGVPTTKGGGRGVGPDGLAMGSRDQGEPSPSSYARAAAATPSGVPSRRACAPRRGRRAGAVSIPSVVSYTLCGRSGTSTRPSGSDEAFLPRR
jgi:hypothetical protein